MHLLFICSRNQWRSPTAEALFKNHPLHTARSAGTEPSARIRVSEKVLRWADVVFVMEKRHRERLRERFPEVMAEKEVFILDIPDDYRFMDAELVEILKEMLGEYLGERE